jgi:hypothetical protein
LSLSIISSATKHHRSGDKTPACGQSLDTAALMNELLRAAMARWFSRIGTNTVILRYICTWHMGSGWYTSALSIICPTIAAKLVSCYRRN